MEVTMRTNALLTCLVAFSFAVADHPAGENKRQAVLLDGLGEVHHPVTTANAEAQKFFDQGLRLIYAFNHDEAVLAFERAAALDAELAMAHWGIALALGPNYNLDADAEQVKAAYQALHRAQKLTSLAPAHERDYIEALSKRYAADPAKADKKQLALAYKQAMGELSKKYPDDLDAATLYAESMMNLRPWELWSAGGKPAEDTLEIIAVLESVLRRNPIHTGANHYYIHAIEASPTPERGLAAAHRLDTLAPAAGHLVHMPAHIYSRVGDYDAAAKANERAAAVDRAYIEKFKVGGVYPMMYYSHNLHFLAVAHHMQGRYQDAKQAADQLAAHVGPHVKDMAMLEFFLPTPTLVQVRFQRWDEILALPPPDAKQPIVKSIWHFARGTAFLAKRQRDPAAKELEALRTTLAGIPEDAPHGDRNKARKVLVIPEQLLAGRLAIIDGRAAEGIKLLEKAVQAEDSLNYIEPADWHLPVRETLGAMHLLHGDAAAAERVFRADLARNRRNARSLLGLAESLQVQGKFYAAQQVRQQFDQAWKNAQVGLRVETY
jgi:tetratricopeptide (TPR) repeat protein